MCCNDSHLQRMMANRVPTSALKVDNFMEKIRENVVEWMFIAWDKLRIHIEVIAFGWARYEILKA